ncbi:MAG: hypothetical protein M3Z17_11450 [Gemmatimonadota bacterium]|nr:hypothetical protein [Gemmatimonadota bacterium]
MTNSSPSRHSALGVFTFLYLWLLIGFTLGTLVLVAPVGWVVNGVHRAGLGSGVERVAVIALVVVYVIISCWLALRLNGYLGRTRSAPVRWGVPVALTLITVLTAWEWKNPGSTLSHMAGGGGDGTAVQTASGAIFEFGAYPDEARLRQLKREGVTTVVSLQHPSDIVERKGIEQEEISAKAAGLQLIKAPMLPWFSENKEALDTLRALALHGQGKYYVHCGLGRDRVNIAKKLIEGTGAKTVSATGDVVALGFEERDRPFIHGTLLHLATGVWLTPYPEHEESYGCLVEGRAGNIALILDPADPEQKKRLTDVTAVLNQYGIRYSLLPVGAATGAGAGSAADSVHRMPLPVTIVASETPWKDGLPRKGAENALAFKTAYDKSRPARSLNGAKVATSYVVPRPATTSEDKHTGC